MVSTSLPSQIASAQPLPICSNTLKMYEKPVKTVCTATDEISAARPTSSLANPYEPSVALCTLTMSTYNGVPASRLPRLQKEVRIYERMEKHTLKHVVDVREVDRDTLEPILFLLQNSDIEVQRAASAALGNLAVNSKGTGHRARYTADAA